MTLKFKLYSLIAGILLMLNFYLMENEVMALGTMIMLIIASTLTCDKLIWEHTFFLTLAIFLLYFIGCISFTNNLFFSNYSIIYYGNCIVFSNMIFIHNSSRIQWEWIENGCMAFVILFLLIGTTVNTEQFDSNLFFIVISVFLPIMSMSKLIDALRILKWFININIKHKNYNK